MLSSAGRILRLAPSQDKRKWSAVPIKPQSAVDGICETPVGIRKTSHIIGLLCDLIFTY